MILIGPFAQAVTMRGLPPRGPIKDDQLEIVPDAGVLVLDGRIFDVGPYRKLRKKAHDLGWSAGDRLPKPGDRALRLYEIDEPMVAFPGMIDCHTHLCFAGTRSRDYAMRLSGKGYLDILKEGGGIHDSVRATVATPSNELAQHIADRAYRQLSQGITTSEVKSGYALEPEEEIRQLKAIRQAGAQPHIDLVATSLAAHAVPEEMVAKYGLAIGAQQHLVALVKTLFPQLKKTGLAQRIDIFIEEGAFPVNLSRIYLMEAMRQGFEVTVHGEQFSRGGVEVAVRLGARSVDHLEVIDDEGILMLSQSNTVGVVLPGASMGLGTLFAPARRLLDSGARLAIASDWNPGSAPMGFLLMQAAVLGAAEKLSHAETWAGITTRAADALGLEDRGRLEPGLLADLIAFPTGDYREILYHQGMMKPTQVWKRGEGLQRDEFLKGREAADGRRAGDGLGAGDARQATDRLEAADGGNATDSQPPTERPQAEDISIAKEEPRVDKGGNDDHGPQSVPQPASADPLPSRPGLRLVEPPAQGIDPAE